jgi:hypothetical protein
MDGLDDEPDGISHEHAKADAVLVAAAPTIIAELLAEVQRLTGLVEAAYEEGYTACHSNAGLEHGQWPQTWAGSDARAALEATQ